MSGFDKLAPASASRESSRTTTGAAGAGGTVLEDRSFLGVFRL